MSNKTYVVTGKSFTGRGQQALVYERFAQGACDIKHVVDHLDAHPKFSTVQTSERIAAYYICVLKKSGHIRELEVRTEPPTPRTGAWLPDPVPETVDAQ